MQVSSIEYERLQALGQFENHRGKVVIECGPGDDPNECFKYAKNLVSFHLGVPMQSQAAPAEQPAQPGQPPTAG